MAMTTIEQHDAEIKALQAQIKAAEEAKARLEKEERSRVRAAQRLAGENHTLVVLRLYDLLGIEPEGEELRMVKGEERIFTLDKAEKERTQRLFDAVAELVTATDSDAGSDEELSDIDSESTYSEDGDDDASGLHTSHRFG